MPASRRARATIFAPRSWPSRPGLATRTRIRLSVIVPLSERRFFVGAKYPAQHVAYFTDGGIGAHRLENVRHQVGVGRGRAGQRFEGRLDTAIIPPLPQLLQLLSLMTGHVLVYDQ